MQNRMAIVLSLGMLLDEVDTSGFIGKLLKKAAEEHPKFVFTPEVGKQAFLLSETFNRGNIEAKGFESQLLQLLGIEKLSSKEFWSEWNKMITLGQVSEKIQLLQDMSSTHKALFYVYSDTNVAHLEQIAKELAEQKINLDTKKHPMALAQFFLYTTYQEHKNRQELLKQIIEDIQSKKSNKPSGITLILGDYKNIKNENHQAVIKNKYDMITKWCQEQDVSVSLHQNSLRETLMKILVPENTIEHKIQFVN